MMLRRLVGLGAALALSAVCGAIYLSAQNPGSPAPVVPQTFFDANGNPLASGTIATYATGTSTSAVTYSDAALNTRNANPITLNSAGRAAIFLSATQVYRFIVSDSSNVQMYSQDDVRPVGYTADQVAQDLSCHVRLTLTTGVPITTAAVTNATTIYATPYQGNTCWLYDGAAWSRVTFTETGLALGSDAASTNYDLFAYSSGGVFTLERLAWTNNTDRATNLTNQNGVRVRSGALTRRYLGTYRTTATIGQTEDSLERRLVWNMEHRTPRIMKVFDDTNSWSYSTNNFRQANASTANMLQFVTGDTSLVMARVVTHVGSSSSPIVTYVGVGDGTTSTPLTRDFVTTNATSAISPVSAEGQAYARIGFMTWVWLERCSCGGGSTATWRGDDGDASLMLSGIWGWLFN